MKYIALLRGINVGGNAKVPMAELRVCFESLGFLNVKTYINSGNVIFETDQTNIKSLRTKIEKCLKKQFGFDLHIVLIESNRYKKIIKSAPTWWGKDPLWKHNVIFLIEPVMAEEAVAAIGALKPDIELVKVCGNVLFQSLEFSKFGQTTTGKLASNAMYKKMTIRNYNTAQKLLKLIQ